MGGTGKGTPDSVTEVLRIGIVLILAFSIFRVADCDCARLLECKGHTYTFWASLIGVQTLLMYEIFRKNPDYFIGKQGA